MRRMRLILGLFCMVFVFSLSVSVAETLTITTYYPSPFGVYNELRSKRMAIGSNYYDQSQYRPNDGDGILDSDEIAKHADLIVQRYLGVGTHQPYAELHVKERPMANEGRPRFVLEDLDTMPGFPNDTYKFQLTLKFL